MNKGDHFVIHSVGAYNMTQWMQFITLRPKVVMTGKNGKSYLIRENESMESITSYEKMPEHLKDFKL